jgi:sarcosine oxidase, subunit beta
VTAQEVVIVGGGVIGCSIAYHLARSGAARVTVVDRGAAPGSGSTGRATGGFRVQFGDLPEIHLSLRSREALERFHDETGVDPGLEARGYLFIARSEAVLRSLRAALATQRAAGCPDAEEIPAERIAEINPAFERHGAIGATYCARDGFIRPMAILRGYRAAAERLGVRFLDGTTCLRFEFDGDRITAVRTEDGSIPAGLVVNAAGAWAVQVARMAGVELPVTPLRRQVAATVPTDALPASMPMTIVADDGFHTRVRDGRVLLLQPDHARVADPFDATVDPAWLDEIAVRAVREIPALRAVPIDPAASWAGLYEMSPDGRLVFGHAPGVENLLLANGSSGHGVMHAPAIGEMAADLVLHGAVEWIDLSPFRPGRFAEPAATATSSLL